ncbi:MAG: xanthine dehydrogenase family protein molybdopterin-binding subunit [Rhodospirillales bacterium]|nr:xanthine dehydrogenase family protein molybdopterin-binding subunit [Rhodospirillales bacterium]MDE0382230.1 xanthine dehydrogenase family protein molybdopterin-binding subunit [Rhodospirillales bacterium]
MNGSGETASGDTRWIGRSLARREDARLLMGQGAYLADLRVPDCLHLHFVRSTQAHARIKDIRLEAALAMPGVAGAITGAELSQEMQGQKIPVLIPAFDANYRQYWPLAVDETYWHGEPLAAVVADDKYVAEDAAAAVEVDYEPLPVVSDAEAALQDGAPRVYADWDSNEIFGTSHTGGSEAETIDENDAAVEALFAKADVVLRQRFRTHRCGVCPIETRGALATWSEADGLTLHLTTQRPHIERLALADLLELSTADVRVIAPRDQGGGFGVKAPFYREHVVACHLAHKFGRPVRWIETREEHLMTVSQERDQIHDLEIAADGEGRILALRNRGTADVGDGRQGVYWGFVMPSLGSVMLPNAYAIRRADIKLRCAVTNKACLSPSRSFGALPTRFALERGLDMLAHRLGLETADLKRRNLITEFPFTSVTGVHHDSGDYVRAWDTLLAKVDLPGFRMLQADARAQGHYLGIGFACGAEFSGIPSDVLVPLENQPGYGVVTMRIDPRGKVAIHEGDAPQGQSHETTMAQVAADAFGIHPDDVSVRHGDTGTTPLSSGTIGARGASYTVAAIAEAATALKAKMARYMIHDHGLEGASPDDFSFREGAVVYEKDGNVRREFAALADRIVMGSVDLPPGEGPGLQHTAYFEAPKPMICFTAQAAKVEVDIETGRFVILDYATCEDVGTVINPIVVEGQVQGGVVQGMSNAMFEEFVYDENGEQLTADFETYRLASAADVPTVTVGHAPTPCADHPLGVRAVGEGRPGPVPAALANAICDALSPYGVEITSLPLKPETILALIETGRARNGA